MTVEGRPRGWLPPERACLVQFDANTNFSNVDVTVIDDEHGGTIRIIHNAQTEMIRRNPQMPCGWALVYEQIGDRTPWLGDQQSERSSLTTWGRRSRAVEV
jgi:hypothetical protein